MRHFEELVAGIWDRFGFEVERTQRTRDGGRDIIAIRHHVTPVKYLIECKRLGEGKPVEIEAVRALWYVKTRDKATKATRNDWTIRQSNYEGIPRQCLETGVAGLWHMEWLNICSRPGQETI